MSSRNSSRSTLTTVPSTMSPSLKYLMVSSIAARKASSLPRSSTATRPPAAVVAGVALPLEVASMLLVMWVVAPVGYIRRPCCPRGPAAGQSRQGIRRRPLELSGDRGSAPYRDRNPRVHRLAYRAHRYHVQAPRGYEHDTR